MSVAIPDTNSMCLVKNSAAITGTDETFKSHSHAFRSMKTMKEMCGKRQLTDITLIVSGVEITAHRLVLSAASDYFYAMFTSDLKEAHMSHITLQQLDPDAVKALVQFCYSGEIQITEENVQLIFSTANALQITEVVCVCSDFLKYRLDPSNCIGFALFAETQGCIDLYDISYSYIMDEFVDVISNQEYLTLGAEEIKKIFVSDMLNVESEENAFNALMKWVNYDLPSRKKNLPSLLQLIKLPLLPPLFLTDQIDTNPIFKENSNCYNQFVEAMKYHLLPDRRNLMHSPRTKPRKSTVGCLFAIGGMEGSRESSCRVEEYNLRDNKWYDFCGMTSARCQFGAAMVDHKLFVVGGRDGLKTLNIVECFDFVLKQWIPMPSMMNHRHGLGVAVLEGPLYAVGGHDGWTFLNTVERYDPNTNQWAFIASLNTQRSTAGIAVLRNRLYAIGGREGSSCLNSVECYDPHSNKWTMICPMATRRGNAGVGVVNEYIFVLGGHDAPAINPGVQIPRFSTVERYDYRTNSWTFVTPMRFGRDAIGISTLGDRLIAVGGYDGQSCSKIVEAYDPNTDQWEELKQLRVGRAGVCVVVLPVEIKLLRFPDIRDSCSLTKYFQNPKWEL